MMGRVAVLKAYGGDFELCEYPVPDPEPGAILIRLTRAGVCGSDLHIWRGEMKEVYGALPRDLTFGHEMCGRVERLGAGIAVDSAGHLRFPYERLVSHVFPLARITEAFQQADWMQRGGDGLRISRAALSMTD